MKLETLDPRVKLAMLLALSTASVASMNLALLALLLAFTALILLLGGVHLGRALWRVRGALGMLAMLFLLQCIFNRSGEPLLRLGAFTLVTTGGVSAAAAVALRLLIVLLSALIILTGQRRDYLLALLQLGLPYEICFMVLAGLHFLPLLREESRDVMYAVQMRGTRVQGTSLKNRLGVYLRVAVPIVAGAIRRSEQMSVAMETRAFRSRPKRTSMRRLRMRRSDWAMLAGFCAALAAIILGVKLCPFL